MAQFKDLNIPVSIVGPGSQPAEEDGEVLDYMKMPNDMSVFSAPVLMDYDLKMYPEAEKVIQALIEALKTFRQNDAPIVIDFSSIPEKDIDFINKFLGEGEVAALYNKDQIQYRIQETVLAGVWRVAGNSEGQIKQSLEIGHVPNIITEKTFADANLTILLPETMPDNTINAPSLLTELSDKSFSWQPGDEQHVVNLTLLPQSPEDLNMLGDYLQEGPTVFLSRGYGSCRVTSTKLKNVWWVQYFNSEDKLILNTLEVTDVPIVTQASMEDIADSDFRIQEMVDSL